MMKARTTNNVQSKRSNKSQSKDQKLHKSSDLDAKYESNNVSSDSTTQSDLSEVYETVDVSYLDDQEPVCDVEGVNFEDKEKIEHLETRIQNLEEELKEVASLEISLYSIVPDHSSSSHKLHTPARRLSRIYIHACKNLSRAKRATFARNSVSGLVLVTRSCGSDVSRLTFWLSNIITLREIILQAFGRSRITQTFDSNESEDGDLGKKSNLKWKNGFQQLLEDWQETETFTTALEKIEFWVFSRIVESVWWQVFTPHMQSPENNSSTTKSNEKLMGPSLDDQKQGTFSISLWKNAFQDALQRLCPMRGSGHECGCLPILAKMVMEKCIGRFDVAMFNAILRESEHQIPTDPVSDPILDSKVLPIPAGDLSFGSGAQLKNAIGNWSRCLAEMFGMNYDDSLAKEDRNRRDDHVESKDSDHNKAFVLLNELSDLLMLPKDMLIESSIREEICPSINLQLIKRILCNFTPDEFCPDHVPGAVLEELNVAESNGYEELSEVNFPYAASSISYISPSTIDVAEKVAEKLSLIQRKGYTSDEELEEMDSPLTSIVEKGSDFMVLATSNVRYKLLRKVWV